MRPLRPGQGRRRAVRAGREGRRHLHLQALACEQPHARPPMLPSAPVTPEQRSRPHGKGMQQYAHLTWLLGDAALLLTLLPHRTRATTADAGRIDHAQTAIGFSAPLVDAQGLPCWAAECAIRLRNKVATREAIGFPGQGLRGWSIPLCRSR